MAISKASLVFYCFLFFFSLSSHSPVLCLYSFCLALLLLQTFIIGWLIDVTFFRKLIRLWTLTIHLEMYLFSNTRLQRFNRKLKTPVLACLIISLIIILHQRFCHFLALSSCIVINGWGVEGALTFPRKVGKKANLRK